MSMRMGTLKEREKRFWKAVKKTSDCWIWLWCRGNGYGCFWYNGRTQPAHRISWLIKYGDIPKDKLVLHKCNNKACVNPEHLYLGSRFENAVDCVMAGNQRGQKLDAFMVQDIRKLFKTGNLTMVDLGKKFRVDASTIEDIVKKRHWNWLPEGALEIAR